MTIESVKLAAADNLWDGQWGLMRIYSRTEDQPSLMRLPGNTEKTHDVLASAFMQDLDDLLDHELLEVVDGDPGDQVNREAQQEPGPSASRGGNNWANFIDCVRSRKDPISNVEATHVASYLGLIAEINMIHIWLTATCTAPFSTLNQ